MLANLLVLAAGLAIASGDVDARLYACDAASPTQLWETGPANEILQVNGGSCLDVIVSSRPPVGSRPVHGFSS